MAYLFADRFLGAPNPHLKQVTALAGGTPVDQGKLAQMLPILALWSLREGGNVTLEPAVKRRLGLFKSDDVRIALIQADGVDAGIEKAIVELLGKSETMDTGNLIKGLVRISNDPFDFLIGRVAESAAELELVQIAHHDTTFKQRLKGVPQSRVEPREGGYENLSQPVDELADRWKQFRENEAALYKTLESGVRSALYRRKKQEGEVA